MTEAESKAKYATSPKGKAAKARYENSPNYVRRLAQ